MFTQLVFKATQQEWTQVIKKRSKSLRTTTLKIKLINNSVWRLVLIQLISDVSFFFSSFILKNTLNRVFLVKKIQGSVVVSVTRSLYKNNIVIITTFTFTVNFLLKKEEIWTNSISYINFQKDQPWYKIIAHKILTLDFNCSEDMKMIINKIKTFNKGLTSIEKLY